MGGGVGVYEAYEVKNKIKGKNYLRRKKSFLYIFMKSLHGEKNKKALIYTTTVAVISL
jgi:hypothetical protein